MMLSRTGGYHEGFIMKTFIIHREKEDFFGFPRTTLFILLSAYQSTYLDFSCLRKEISRRGIARFLRVNAIICMAVKATRHALIGYRPVSADTVHEKSLVPFIVAFTISAFEICRSCEKDYLSIAWIIYQSSVHNFGKL